MPRIRSRIAEDLIGARLRTHGGVLITGPKAVGKTTTAESFAESAIFLDRDRAGLTAAQTDPDLVLDGDAPRLIDEYQLADGLWEAVRGRIDSVAGKGLFLLTGSSTPERESRLHSGAARIAPVSMRTMSFMERGLSAGKVSVGRLLDGELPPRVPDRISVADLVEVMAIGGWPANLDLTTQEALDANADYLDMIIEVDMARIDGVRRDPYRVRRLLASYARNVATDAALRTIGRASDEPVAEATLHSYLAALSRQFLIEDQDAWKPSLRSRVRLAATPKRHLADPSLAIAALGATPERLLRSEIEWAGFLFESQVIHDLRVYAAVHRSTLRFYRDNKGLEIDGIVESRDGRWIGIEVKLGHDRIDEAASNLLSLRGKVAGDVSDRCGGLAVVTANSPTYVRSDGIVVTSIAALGP
ncbi:MAG: ATP-binding protein [Acidobacteria bacterium]|nr:MAG: ATP-binding protein [Acidobacteriota bacterium]